MANRTTTYTAIIGIALATCAAIPVGADPDGSQHLRGLGGRIFAIEGEYLSALPGSGIEVGDTFDNCYTFNEDGSWIDPLFVPGLVVPGDWEQHSTGANTSYTAIADGTGFFGLLLVQNGTVTPAEGGGALQLDAFSTILIPAAGNLALATVRSVGAEVDVCPF